MCDRCQWRDIETAPKDGTWVFLYVPGHGPVRAKFTKICGWLGHSSGKIITKATHWMLLPDAPRGEAK